MKIPKAFVEGRDVKKKLEDFLKGVNTAEEKGWEATATVLYFYCSDIQNQVFLEYNEYGDILRVGSCYKYKGKGCCERIDGKCHIFSFYNNLNLKRKD